MNQRANQEEAKILDKYEQVISAGNILGFVDLVELDALDNAAHQEIIVDLFKKTVRNNLVSTISHRLIKLLAPTDFQVIFHFCQGFIYLEMQYKPGNKVFCNNERFSLSIPASYNRQLSSNKQLFLNLVNRYNIEETVANKAKERIGKIITGDDNICNLLEHYFTNNQAYLSSLAGKTRRINNQKMAQVFSALGVSITDSHK